jgi:hypothetical protein
VSWLRISFFRLLHCFVWKLPEMGYLRGGDEHGGEVWAVGTVDRLVPLEVRLLQSLTCCLMHLQYAEPLLIHETRFYQQYTLWIGANNVLAIIKYRYYIKK